MQRFLMKLVFLLSALIVAGVVSAHDTRPLYIEIAETAPDTYAVSWKVPITVAATNIPEVTLPETCRPLRPVAKTATARSQDYTCDTDLSNEIIAFSYPRYNPSVSTLMHFSRLSGETYSEVLSPDKTEWVVPAKENTWLVARDYTVLGIEHILEGFDHLLFIVCLVLLAGTLRRVVITITGFTIAHSITLGLAALGLVTVPVAAVEASIALSIVFVAYEIARGRRNTLKQGHAVFRARNGQRTALLPACCLPRLLFKAGIEFGRVLDQLGRVLMRAQLPHKTGRMPRCSAR